MAGTLPLRRIAARRRFGAIRRGMPPADHPGLRLRLAHEARRVAAQHDAIDAFEREVRAAFEGGAEPAIERSLRSLERALAAHFAIERDVHFPALHGLAPALAPELRALEQEHRHFLEDLARLLADRDAPVSSRLRAFSTLTEALQRHEDREEALLGRSTPAKTE